MVNKKAISPVITTILLILIAIAAVGILAAFILPMVRDPQKRGECFKAIDQIEIDTTSGYTCWRAEDPDGTADTGDEYLNLTVSVKRGAESLGIEGFFITVYGQGSSQTFELRNNQAKEGIAMLGSPYGTPITVPMRREMKTYTLNVTGITSIDSAGISPVVEGNIFCDEVNRKNIGPC